MSYTCQVWAQKSSLKTQRVLVLQKRAIRLITFSDFRAPSSPLLVDLKILSFFDFVKMCNILFLHQLINGKLPHSLLNNFVITFNARNHSNSRMKSGLLRLPRTSTISFGTHSIQHQSIASWNLLQSFLQLTICLATLSLAHLNNTLLNFTFSRPTVNLILKTFLSVFCLICLNVFLDYIHLILYSYIQLVYCGWQFYDRYYGWIVVMIIIFFLF